MVDKITNSIINLENKASKNSANVKNSVSKVDNYRSEDSTNININQKKVISDLASSAPIDNDKISKPFIQNKNLFLIKDNAIIKLN